ncbi:unnamed protein product [Allacma fusca]|uniref:diacylglycerol O-acyltransferase n=1 Tax=Allacma fusca TaxID=39272 RepID=A0A8J2PW16_9HEXA|nr:unnamed protein product [Allacma fusca]
MLLQIISHAFGWILFLATIPFGFLVFFPLRLWKWAVILTARYFRPDLKALLTAYDSIFAIDKFFQKPYAANVTFFIVEGHISLDKIKSGFARNVLNKETEDGEKLYDRLYQVPVSYGGYYFWQEVPVDIDKQIRCTHEFKTNDHQNELNQILGDLMTSPLPGALWEILLYTGYQSDKSVVVFRIHHTLGDGYSFNHLVDEMIEQSSKYMVKIPPLSVSERCRLLATAPTRVASLYQEAFTHSDCFTKRKINDQGVVSITSVPLDVMKAIRRKTNTHFATVGMSVLGGAIRRFYLEQNRKMPAYVSVMHSLPKSGHPLTQMCNHWGVGLFKVPLSCPSALERLEKTERSYNQYMGDQYDQLIHSHIPLFSLLPNAFLKLFFSTNFGTGMGFTSVPAYDKEAHLWGHRVLNMYKIFGLQWRQSAVAAAVYTHNGQVAYTIFSNKDIIEDQAGVDQVTREYLHAEVQQLCSELGIQVTPWNNNNNQRPIRSEGFA